MKKFKFRRVLSSMLIAVFIFTQSACSGPSTTVPSKDTETPSTADIDSSNSEEIKEGDDTPEIVNSTYKINICTATSSGLFYSAGVALAQNWQETIDGYFTSATSSSGSGENVTLIQNGEANIGFIQSDVLLNAYNGEGDYQGSPHTDFRVLCPMFANPYNLMINKDSGINDIKDVKGKRVVTGRPASGTLTATVALLDSFDISLEDVVPSYLDQAQSVESLRNGLADFALAAGTIPMAVVTDAMTGNSNIRLLGLTQEQVDTVLAKKSWLLQMNIPANTYDNQPDELLSVGHNAFLVVKADMPDDVAYRLVMSMYENKEWLFSAMAGFNNPCFNAPSDSLNSIGVPVHPGAEIALKQLGLLK